MKLIALLILLAGIVFFFIHNINKNKDKDIKYREDQINALKGTKKASERLNNVVTPSVNISSNILNSLDINGKAIINNSMIFNKSYGPKLDPIIQQGNSALTEMSKLYISISDEAIKSKISEISNITYKIIEESIRDSSDIPQIKKFFRYYLPTTIKLLSSYQQLESVEINGENIDKSKKNITEMLDVAIDAYKKRLDSLFENQALDIETDIDVMNQMLEREGLLNKKDILLKEGTQNG